MFHKFLRLPDPKQAEARFVEESKGEPLEKKDVPAMILAAVLVLLPALLGVILVFLFVFWFFFLRF